MLRKSCSSTPEGVHHHTSGCLVLPGLLAVPALAYFSRSTSECHLISVHPEAQGQLMRGHTQRSSFWGWASVWPLISFRCNILISFWHPKSVPGAHRSPGAGADPAHSLIHCEPTQHLVIEVRGVNSMWARPCVATISPYGWKEPGLDALHVCSWVCPVCDISAPFSALSHS